MIMSIYFTEKPNTLLKKSEKVQNKISAKFDLVTDCVTAPYPELSAV